MRAMRIIPKKAPAQKIKKPSKILKIGHPFIKKHHLAFKVASNKVSHWDTLGKRKRSPEKGLRFASEIYSIIREIEVHEYICLNPNQNR